MGTNFPTIVLTGFMSLMYFVMYSIITLNMTVGSYSGYCLASCSGKGKKKYCNETEFPYNSKMSSLLEVILVKNPKRN